MKIKIKGYMLVLSLIALVVLLVTGCKNMTDNSSKTYVDLKTYFKLGAYVDEGETYGEARADEYSVVLDGQVVNTRGISVNGAIYLDIEYVNDYINNFVYWDSNEEICIYALPYETIAVGYGKSSYTQADKTVSCNGDIVIKNDNRTYVNLDFVKRYTAMEYISYDEEIKRIIINTRFGETEYVTAKKKTKLREGNTVKNHIVEDISANQKLRFLQYDEEKKWMKVESESGMVGYIMSEEVSEPFKEQVLSDFTEIVYPSIKKDFFICMAWQQMEYAGGNDSFATLTKNAKGLNVIAPTWFKVKDGAGNISSLASSTYVKNAHKKGIEVWALISDMDYKNEEGVYYVNEVLAYTSRRQRLISNLMTEILECGADGINIDFEKIAYRTADDYIQFLRELSIECRKNNIVLSVDNYAPTAGNSYYNRRAQSQVVDYCIIMGYDEHWSGSREAGSVASLPFVENGIVNTLKEVPADKLINAVPFYTRVWVETPEALTDGSQEIIEDPIYGNYALSSKAVGMQAAINLLESHNVNKVWLEQLGQYYGEYKDEGKTYRIWLEEDRSMEEKLKLIEKYELTGVAAWKLGLEYKEIWNIIGK